MKKYLKEINEEKMDSKNASAEEAENIFIDRLARIFLEQILGEQKKEKAIRNYS